MKYNLVLLLSFCTVIVFTSCNKGGKTGLLIPKDAGVVIHLDLSSVSSKLSWQEIKQTGWYTELQKTIKDSATAKLLANPAASGIDTDGTMVLFTRRNESHGYIAFEGKIKNIEEFKSAIQQAGEGRITVSKDGDLNFAHVENNNDGILYFNDKVFVFVADASDIKLASKNKPGSGATQNYPIDSLKYFARNTFSLKGDDLLDSDKRFENLIAEKADMHFWVNSGYLHSGSLSGPLSLMKLSNVLTDNISAGTANFENGKIVANSKHYFNKNLTELFRKYSGKTISDNALNRLPDNALAAFAMNFNPDGIKDLLKLLGIDGIANAALGQLGANFTVDDFIKANAGELAVAVTGFSIVEKPATITIEGDNGPQVIPYMDKKAQINYALGVSVNDKQSSEKLMAALNAVKSLGVFSFSTEPGKDLFKNKSQNDWLAIGSSDAEVDALLTQNNKSVYTNSFSGHNGAGFVDLQKFISSVATNNKDSADKKLFAISAATWKNINFYWDMKEGVATSHLEINLADSSGNSLKQLNKYADEMYKAISTAEPGF